MGSLVGMDRKILIKSGSLFIPTILAGIVGSSLLGIVAGLLIGKSPIEMITAYVLPIMGGGAGAGAIPMSQVYADVTGEDPAILWRVRSQQACACPIWAVPVISRFLEQASVWG